MNIKLNFDLTCDWMLKHLCVLAVAESTRMASVLMEIRDGSRGRGEEEHKDEEDCEQHEFLSRAYFVV